MIEPKQVRDGVPRTVVAGHHGRLGDPVARFWSKVKKLPDPIGIPDDAPAWKRHGCWIWTGHKTPSGYGRFTANTRVRPAHHVAHELLVGPIPEDLQPDHLCRVRSCVNPSHIEPVTCRENILRGVGITAMAARKTHCLHGHAFSVENTYLYHGERHCKECKRARWREWYAARKRA